MGSLRAQWDCPLGEKAKVDGSQAQVKPLASGWRGSPMVAKQVKRTFRVKRQGEARDEDQSNGRESSVNQKSYGEEPTAHMAVHKREASRGFPFQQGLEYH